MADSKVFDVKGMTCDNCVHHVTEAVRGVEGVKDVKVDLGSNTAKVEGDFDDAAIIAAVEEEGYEAVAR